MITLCYTQRQAFLLKYSKVSSGEDELYAAAVILRLTLCRQRFIIRSQLQQHKERGVFAVIFCPNTCTERTVRTIPYGTVPAPYLTVPYHTIPYGTVPAPYGTIRTSRHRTVPVPYGALRYRTVHRSMRRKSDLLFGFFCRRNIPIRNTLFAPSLPPFSLN